MARNNQTNIRIKVSIAHFNGARSCDMKRLIQESPFRQDTLSVLREKSVLGAIGVEFLSFSPGGDQ
jgi:hypothetical protein